MRHKLLVQVLVTFVVGLLASAAVAASGSFADPSEPPDEAEQTPFGALRSTEARAFGACMSEAAADIQALEVCRSLQPGPAHEHPDHPGRDSAGENDDEDRRDDGENDDEDRRDDGENDDGGDAGDVPFGTLRSTEVRAFGACMRETQGHADARQKCFALRPGPAVEHPAHPAHGDAGEEGGDDGEGNETGERPGEGEGAEQAGDAATAAGQDSVKGGPPEGAGPPEHAGPPEGAGPPEHAGPPEGAGPPEHAGGAAPRTGGG